MNAKEAAEMISTLEEHIHTVDGAEEFYRDRGDDYKAGKLWEVAQTLHKVIDDLEERLESVKV